MKKANYSWKIRIWKSIGKEHVDSNPNVFLHWNIFILLFRRYYKYLIVLICYFPLINYLWCHISHFIVIYFVFDCEWVFLRSLLWMIKIFSNLGLSILLCSLKNYFCILYFDITNIFFCRFRWKRAVDKRRTWSCWIRQATAGEIQTMSNYCQGKQRISGWYLFKCYQ